MKKVLLLFMLMPFIAFAQVSDDFSDGDFTNNPTWLGTDGNYIVNSNLQLQLNAEEAGESYLSLPFATFETMQWNFWIRESFAPSGNNFSDVYLCADNANLMAVTQGYFLRFGEGGSSDAITLYRKDTAGEQQICRGTEGAIAASFSVAVQVNCDREGHWSVQTCYDGSGIYAIEAEGVDDSFPREGYFGIYSKYTASNAKKVYFDDVYVGPKIVDNEPPVLLTTTVVGDNQLQLRFDEALDETSALNTDNYFVSKGMGHPIAATFADNQASVLLTFDHAFSNAENYTLTINNIADISGNVMPPTEARFSVFEATKYDIVINEIMADPSPVVGLPEWEYVELYNTTEFDCDLTGWQIQIGANDNTFDALVLPAHSYLILCHKDAVPELKSYGECVGFSSFSIGNSASVMYLNDANGQNISQVAFSNTWYHDPDKTSGGWSVEQIDPSSPCAGASNWTASVDSSGGTPGKINSVDGENAELPKVQRVGMFSNYIVQIWFDQQMEPSSLATVTHFVVEATGEHPQQANTNPMDATFVELIFDHGFEEGIVYTLVINDVENCIGNAIASDTKVNFGIPNAMAAGDILLNEILFDPIAPGVDYVELYNHSDKTFDLSNLMLGVIKESFPQPADTTLKEICSETRLFLPETYVLLSTNGAVVGEQYQCDASNFVDMPSFPSYANAGGTAVLMSKDGTTIDQMNFSEKMHYPLLKVTKGVSLERVSWDVASDQADNWHSAAESVHFGTPGYANSMQQAPTPSSDAIKVAPELFSPDGDGYNDNCLIVYHFDEAGYTLNTYIFSTGGQLMRHLAKGELVGQEGSIVWNGTDDNGNRVPLGIYVIITEVFNLDGTVKKFKNGVVVATR